MMSQQPPTPQLALAHLTRAPLVPPADGERPPLLALLHGVGSNERDLFSLAPQLDPRMRIVSARAPLTRAPGSYAWFHVQFVPGGFVIDPAQLDASRQTLATFLDEAVAAYDADPARVYLFGFSQGAIMSLVTAIATPQRLAGVVALAGRIPPEALPWAVAPEQTEGLPVLLAHGRADSVIPVEWAHRARATLEQQRVALTYREYDTDHRIPPPMLQAATTWLDERLAEPRWTPLPTT